MVVLFRVGGVLTVVVWSMALMTSSNGCPNRRDPVSTHSIGQPENAALVRELKHVYIVGGKGWINELRAAEGQAVCWDPWISGESAGVDPFILDYNQEREIRRIPHSGRYGGCWLSPDQSVILSKVDEPKYAICLRDCTTGNELTIFEGHEAEIAHILWMPDGKRFVSIGKELRIFVWNIEARISGSGEVLKRYTAHRTHYPSAIAVSADGKRVASADWGGYVYVWDPHSLKTIREFPRLVDPDYVPPVKLERYYEDFRGDSVLALEFFPCSQRLALVTKTGNVVVLDVRSGAEVMRYRQPGGATPDDLVPARYVLRTIPLAVSPDGRRILYSMQTQPIRLLDAQTGQLIAEFQRHTRQGRWDLNDVGQPGGVRCLAFSPDGKLAISGGDDGTLRLWKLPP